MTRPGRPWLNSPTGAWIICLVAVYALYTVVPLVFFNHGDNRIAGMPSMLFWFTLLPWVIPGMMFVLYVIDGRMMRTLTEENDE